MKKLVLIIIAICLICLPLSTAHTVMAKTPDGYAISASEIDELTQKICEEIKDRTSFTDAIKNAAEVIAGLSDTPVTEGDAEVVAYSDSEGYLSSDGLNIEVQTFKRTVAVQQGFSYVEKDIESQNVIATVKNFDENKKTVLITTNFANHYSENDAYYGLAAEGALGTAATTALTIKLANYLSDRTDNKYNFVFAFFSGTDEGNFGSEAYVEERLKGNDMLVINLERLGCGNTYFYTDEAPTAHGELISNLAAGYGMQEFPTDGRVLLDIDTGNGLPYSHYALRGDISPFFKVGKSCLELIGGNFTKIVDDEGGEKYLTNTVEDTYQNLKEYYPDYAEKLSTVAQFVIELTAKSELSDVCSGAATSYKPFTKAWIAYVISLGVIIILILIMILVMHRLEKKHPIPAPHKVKVAVFGKEFEDFKSDEIIVDIKRNNNNDVNPFDI